MVRQSIRGLGWVPDIPSVKDYSDEHEEIARMLAQTKLKTGRPKAAKGAKAAPFPPSSADLRKHFSPIENQWQLGSCTAHAAVALVEYFEKRASGKHIDASRLFVYKASRNLLGWTGDTGAYIRTAMGALALFGAPPEAYWPYDGRDESVNDKFDVEPSAFCYAFASNYQSIRYLRLDTASVNGAALLGKIKLYLAAGFPSMFGFPVYGEFMNPSTADEIAYPRQNSRYYGGHAIAAAGYDDNKRIGADKGALLIRNSWGTGWGDKGYAWMSYKYVTEGLALDWWTVLRQEWVDTGNF